MLAPAAAQCDNRDNAVRPACSREVWLGAKSRPIRSTEVIKNQRKLSGRQGVGRRRDEADFLTRTPS